MSDMTPEQIDERLFPLWAERWQIASYLDSYRAGIAYTVWPEAAPVVNGMRKRGVSTVQFRHWGEQIDECEAKLAANAEARKPYEDEFDRRGGWVRYVLCGNNNGHLHYHGCSSLRWNTELLLVAQASGLDHSEVVGRFGETACTKCFPDAPVAAKSKPLPEGMCAGSGTYEVESVNGSFGLYRPWGRCKVCGQGQSVTSTGKLRRHKEPTS